MRSITGKKLYIVWHQDSPGVKVIVVRRFRPRSGFSRIGELHVATNFPIGGFHLGRITADTTADQS